MNLYHLLSHFCLILYFMHSAIACTWGLYFSVSLQALTDHHPFLSSPGNLQIGKLKLQNFSLLSNLPWNLRYFSSSGFFQSLICLSFITLELQKNFNYRCVFYPWIIPSEIGVKLNNNYMHMYTHTHTHKIRSRKVGPRGDFRNFIVLSAIHSRQERHPLMLAYSHIFPLSLPYLANCNLSHWDVSSVTWLSLWISLGIFS